MKGGGCREMLSGCEDAAGLNCLFLVDVVRCPPLYASRTQVQNEIPTTQRDSKVTYIVL